MARGTRSQRARGPGRSRRANGAYNSILATGHSPLRNCWPTYLVIREDKLPVVVHACNEHGWIDEPRQSAMLQLMKCGIECFAWLPVKGLIRVLPDPKGYGVILEEDQGKKRGEG